VRAHELHPLAFAAGAATGGFSLQKRRIGHHPISPTQVLAYTPTVKSNAGQPKGSCLNGAKLRRSVVVVSIVAQSAPPTKGSLNLKVAGSNPAPAPTLGPRIYPGALLLRHICFWWVHGDGLRIKNFFSRLLQIGLYWTARRALALAPRGAVPNDVLVLTNLSIPPLQIEWRARGLHPWDRDLSPALRIKLFHEQALQDTEDALRRLFSVFPGMEQIVFRVLEPAAPNRVIAAGNIARGEFDAADRFPSLRMRLHMMGVRIATAGGELEPVAA
jgi:hypothetical protein